MPITCALLQWELWLTPVPPLVFATPKIDVESGNGILGMAINALRWNADRILACSLIFKRESAYDAITGSIDHVTTSVLLANNSLHYGRTTDVERFLIAYDDSGMIPLGVGFGSFGAPQSWNVGQGGTINIPGWVPVIGGRRIVTFKDDQPLTSAVNPHVVAHNGINILPWDGLESTSPGNLTRRLYISTPNHMFDFVNRNGSMPHVDQAHGIGSFQSLRCHPPDSQARRWRLARIRTRRTQMSGTLSVSWHKMCSAATGCFDPYGA